MGELPLDVQAKLLRVLEHGEVQRVGRAAAETGRRRVIAATNRDLAASRPRAGSAADLYYRLNVVELHVPPLRDRREDIPYLVGGIRPRVRGRPGSR